MSDFDKLDERRREENRDHYAALDARDAKERQGKVFWDATLAGEHDRALAALDVPVVIQQAHQEAQLESATADPVTNHADSGETDWDQVRRENIRKCYEDLNEQEDELYRALWDCASSTLISERQRSEAHALANNFDQQRADRCEIYCLPNAGILTMRANYWKDLAEKFRSQDYTGPCIETVALCMLGVASAYGRIAVYASRDSSAQ
jgi:hypothetical protein